MDILKNKLFKVLVLFSAVLHTCANPTPAKDFSPWPEDQRWLFTVTCFNSLSRSPELAHQFTQVQLKQACECMTDYYETRYDYEKMKEKSTGWTRGDENEMFGAAYNCAKWIFDSEQVVN